MTYSTSRATRRSDADIFAEARNALDRHPAIPSTVRVHVDSGIATLTGTVRLAAERADAETIVRQVAGVERVVNDITVPPLPSGEGFELPDEQS